MPTDLTDLNEFTTPVTAPAGSDPHTVASWNLALQALANRTHYLREELITAASKQVTISVFGSFFASGWDIVDDAILRSNENSAELWLPLDFLPDGAVLTAVEARVNPDGGAPMTLDVRRRVFNWASAGSGTTTDVSVGVTSSGAGIQTLTAGSLSETINKTGRSYVARLTANTSAGASVDDVYGWRVTATVPGGKG
jgi:hypothetical protein